MALVTYILLAALTSGLQDRFHPEVLGRGASRALAVVLLEFVFVKAGCYLLNISGSSQVTDLVAYGGYKFVGYVFDILIFLSFVLLFDSTIFLELLQRSSRDLLGRVERCTSLRLLTSSLPMGFI